MYIASYIRSFILHIAATVNFSQSMYSVNENNLMIQLMLILSNPSSREFTIDVLNTDESTSKCQQSILYSISL